MGCSVTQLCPTLWDPIDCNPPGSSVHGNSPGKNTGVSSHALLQGIFPIQGSKPGLPHWRWILYHLSHQGSPKILECVAYPFSRGSSWPRNRIRFFYVAGGFFTSWATREAQFDYDLGVILLREEKHNKSVTKSINSSHLEWRARFQLPVINCVQNIKQKIPEISNS